MSQFFLGHKTVVIGVEILEGLFDFLLLFEFFALQVYNAEFIYVNFT